MEKAIIYFRTSSIDQHPELQLQECRDYCKNKTWEIVDELEEKKSAWKDESKREEFNKMLERAKQKEFSHIVVWNMDRFSRQPEDDVLNLTQLLSLMYSVQVHAVHGDVWSEMIETVGKLKEMGFIGKAILEFLEKLIKGLEYQRAHRESQVKSERVKLAVMTEDGITKSYKGNKWGRKSLSKNVVSKVLELRNQGISVRDIAKQVSYYDKNNNLKPISPSAVHKIIKLNSEENKGNAS